MKELDKNLPYTSWHKILGTVLLSTLMASLLAPLLLFMTSGPMALIAVVFAIQISFKLIIPLIPLAFVICVFMDRKGFRDRKIYILIASLTSLLYSLILYYYVLEDPMPIMIVAFPLGGFFSGWIYWNILYKEKEEIE